MLLIGYARVYSVGQSPEVQLDKRTAHDCEKIHQEKLSGTTAQRPTKLKACLDYVRDGDLLVGTTLERLAHSTLDLHKILARLTDDDVGFRVLDQSLDTTAKYGRLKFSILTAVAEFENELRKERQREGREE